MFILKKVIASFILPPGIFILMLFISAFWFLLKRNKTAGLFNSLLGILIWGLSTSPISNALLFGLEHRYQIPQNPGGDVIILLGGTSNWGAPDLTGKGSLSGNMMARVITAVRLQRMLHVPVIVSSGQVYEDLPSDAHVVKRFLTDLGVPPDKVILEDKSRDTMENAIYSSKLCKRLGFKRPLLVTSAFHMARALLSFQKVGIKVAPIPAQFYTWQERKYSWHDYLPNISNLKRTVLAIREKLGYFIYSNLYLRHSIDMATIPSHQR